MNWELDIPGVNNMDMTHTNYKQVGMICTILDNHNKSMYASN